MVTEVEIPEGYKQTEVGVIPEDWGTRPLAELCIEKGLVRGPFGGSLKKAFFVKSGYKVYEQKNAINRDSEIGNYYIDTQKFQELKRFEVKAGDFIISCSGTIGRIFQIPSGSPKGVINQALLKLTTDPQIVRDDYFYHYFDWDRFQLRIIDNTHGGAMPNLVGMSIFKNTEIPLPPNIEEQAAVATVLNDINSLINRTDELITKKRNIKQGTMQQILTGKKRLPGFNGEWEEKKLGKLFSFSGGLSASRDQLSDDGFCYLHYGDIHTSNKNYVDVSDEFLDIPKLDIPKNIIPSKSILNDGDVVFVDASEDDDGASKHVVVRNSKSITYISGLHTIVSKSKDDSLDNKYKRYCFQTNEVKRQFKFYSVGTKVTGISKTNIKKIIIPLPSKEEQSAIAQVLSDMDAEIEAWEEKLNKYRMIKQGMMQELLTGKTRLL
jgi:type I restriction enzyme, S subunit